MVLSQLPYKLSKALLPSAYAVNLYLETGVGHNWEVQYYDRILPSKVGSLVYCKEQGIWVKGSGYQIWLNGILGLIDSEP